MERSQSAPEQPQAQPQGFGQTDFGPSPNSPNPQPNNPPPASVPNPHTDMGARIKENLSHFKTTMGILKILSVVIGLVAVVLIVYAYFKATVVAANRSSDDTLFSSPSLCHRSNTKFCDLDTYFKDSLCKKGRNEETCVSVHLATIPPILVGATWWATFSYLIRTLLIPRGTLRSRSFYRVDTYYYLAAAIVIIVAAVMLIVYFVQVAEEDLCSETNLKAEAIDYVVNNGPKPNSKSSSPRPSTTNSSDEIKIGMVLADLTKRCPDMQAEKYYHLHFLIVAIFAIITGIVYLVIAALSKKESSNAVEPARMVMGPNGPQLRDPSTPQPQAQVQSATNL